jgi:hypothetical protein
MINLYDNETGELVGTINLKQLTYLMEQLEEESTEDKDYYINRATLDVFEARGADPDLVKELRKALGNQDDMELRWEHA